MDVFLTKMFYIFFGYGSGELIQNLLVTYHPYEYGVVRWASQTNTCQKVKKHGQVFNSLCRDIWWSFWAGRDARRGCFQLQILVNSHRANEPGSTIQIQNNEPLATETSTCYIVLGVTFWSLSIERGPFHPGMFHPGHPGPSFPCTFCHAGAHTLYRPL